MKEKDFQVKFTRWLRYRWEGSGAFELKISHTRSLPYSAVLAHQVAALQAVKTRGMEYKIPDDTLGSKPFDCFRLHGPAYVVVMFYTRACRRFYLIDVDRWVEESQASARKSLTEERAAEIGTVGEFA